MCNKSVVTVLYCTVIRIELIRNDSWSKWRVRPPGSLWIDHCLITWRAHGDAPPQNGPTVLPLLESFIIWRWASDLIVIQDQHRKKTNQTLTSKPGQLRPLWVEEAVRTRVTPHRKAPAIQEVHSRNYLAVRWCIASPQCPIR